MASQGDQVEMLLIPCTEESREEGVGAERWTVCAAGAQDRRVGGSLDWTTEPAQELRVGKFWTLGTRD